MQGTLHPGFLPTLLGELFIEGKSGVLRLARGDQAQNVRLRNGRIIQVRTTPPERSNETPLPGSLDKRLGFMLQQLGIPKDKPRREPPQLQGGREALIEALTWEEGTYAFEEQPVPASEAEDASPDLSMPEVIQEAVRRLENSNVDDVLGDVDRVLTLGPGERQVINLTPTDRLVLSRVDGARTIREVIERTPVASEEARQSLFSLLFAGVVECVSARADEKPVDEKPAEQVRADAEPVAVTEAAPPPAGHAAPVVHDEAVEARRREMQDALQDLLRKNHFEVLGVPRGASDLEIKEAYFGLVKQFHPDRQTDPALADLRKELEALFIRIGEAYEVLGHPRRRARYEAELGGPLPGQPPEATVEAENALVADDAIRKAEQLMGESQYWDAIQLLEAVIPGIQSMRLKHEAQVRLARAYTKNPKWVRRGEELLQAVVREDPSCVDAYYALGAIYRGNNLKSRAITMFKKVLELKPKHRPAAAEIRSLEAPPAPKGLLRKS